MIDADPLELLLTVFCWIRYSPTWIWDGSSTVIAKQKASRKKRTTFLTGRIF